MAAPYTLKKPTDVEDSGARFGLDAVQEARFAKDDLDAADTGVSHQRLKLAFGPRLDGDGELFQGWWSD